MDLFDVGAESRRSESDSLGQSNSDGEFQYWLSRLQRNGLDLQYVPSKLRSDKILVEAAVEECGNCALQYAISRDTDLQMKPKKPSKSLNSQPCVPQDNAGLGRHSHHQTPKEAHHYWLSRVSKNGLDLQHAPRKIRGNKKIVMAAVQECGWALEHALPSVQQDKDVVIVAVSKSPGTIKHASPALQKDNDVTDAAVQKSGRSLPPRYASNDADVDVRQGKMSPSSYDARDGGSDITAAIIRNRKNIKVVRDAIQIASGIVEEVKRCSEGTSDAKSPTKKKKKKKKKTMKKKLKKKRRIVYVSTRSSLNDDPFSYSDATRFTEFLKAEKYVRTSKLQIDDSRSIRMDSSSNHVPCRSQSEETIKTGHTHSTDGKNCGISCLGDNEGVCLQLRHRLQDAKDTGGFMLQLVETGESYSRAVPSLSDRQRLEYEIAQVLEMKIFQVYKPRSPGNIYETYFAKRHIKDVVSAIQDWYESENKLSQDMSACVLRPPL